MIRVLFVCLGNICRSPLAEAVFRHNVKQSNLENQIEIDSAGTGGWHIGNPPHQGTREILQQNEISFDGIVARQVSSNDLEEFDYIIAMDASNIENLKKLTKQFPASKVYRLMDFVHQPSVMDIPDPYFTGNFEEVYQLVEEGCTHLLHFIIKQHEGIEQNK
ncbi:protein-tyrosine phosphatase [Bacillus oleivorans]|uniref:protein-tyrosine-phosphatase n=1 Tax=Bacillus oleivorans TaxID=1448271 RepID=A0A285CS68_9BACI|nr:low molecular weight protein-tyrosine-phosphatase [Bacillus oleivorans]SNX70401.1 protein-tyrosine phosphatase [Bacillus oleivorans]